MNDNIKKLREIIANQLVALIDKDYVLLDLPNHANIGDNMIWEGEEIFLRKHIAHSCKFSSNWYNVNIDKIEDNIILFHGGGNFGDLYYECQKFRMDIVNRFPNNRIIIFPQSVYYNDKSKMENDMKVFNSHNNIIICARDQVSYNVLKEYIDESKLLLLPDMAFFIDLKSDEHKSNRVLIMQRTDHEKKDSNDYIEDIIRCNPNNKVDVCDWPSFSNNKYINSISNIIFHYHIVLSTRIQSLPILSLLVDHRYGLRRRDGRERYIKQGVSFMSKYDQVYTTRLHGLILATLMNKKVYIVDNKYAKCINYYQTWLKDFSNIELYK